jgi:hypothetical protein
MYLPYLLHKGLVLSKINDKNGIPVDLRDYSRTGTVQDDPFDDWVAQMLSANTSLNVHHAGKLTSPDIVVFNDERSVFAGLEVKKLDANKNGKDPRGLTLDYNSTVPCGSIEIKIKQEIRMIDCYYFFALIFDGEIRTSVLCHGDYLNNDFQLHKESKTSNISTYNYGSFGEASVRHRKMYTFPNPLNSNLPIFANHHSLIVPSGDTTEVKDGKYQSISVHHRDLITKNDATFKCYSTNPNMPSVVNDVFAKCKIRTGKDRTPYMVQIDS